MATAKVRVQTTTESANEAMQGAWQNATDKIPSYTSEQLSTMDAFGDRLAAWVQKLLNIFSTPEQRRAMLDDARDFVLAKPKLSIFLGLNIALAGIPVALFMMFSFSVAMSSLLAAIFFTTFWIGIALFIILPTVFLTSMTAGFLFLWVLGGFYILKVANSYRQSDSTKPSSKVHSISDSMEPVAGDRFSAFLDSIETKKASNDVNDFSD